MKNDCAWKLKNTGKEVMVAYLKIFLEHCNMSVRKTIATAYVVAGCPKYNQA
jgi:hypothetical protein